MGNPSLSLSLYYTHAYAPELVGKTCIIGAFDSGLLIPIFLFQDKERGERLVPQGGLEFFCALVETDTILLRNIIAR
jgi:hypothetical protein